MKSKLFLSLLLTSSLIVVAAPKSEPKTPGKNRLLNRRQLVQKLSDLDLRQATDLGNERSVKILLKEFTHIILVESLLESESYLKPPHFDYTEDFLVEQKNHIEVLDEENQHHSYLKITNEVTWDQITVSSREAKLAALIFKDRIISCGLVNAKIEDLNLRKSAIDFLKEWSFFPSNELPFMVFKDKTGRRSLFSFINMEIDIKRCQEIKEVRKIVYVDLERGDVQIVNIPIKRDQQSLTS